MKTGSTALPGDLSLVFGDMGQVTSCASAIMIGTEDGTIDLLIKDGSRPASQVMQNLSLRRLLADGYTIFEQQVSGGAIVNSAGVEGFVFTMVNLGDGITNLDPIDFVFNGLGAITSFNALTWNVDGTFDFEIVDGSRPMSYISGMNLSLRHINSLNFMLMEGEATSIHEINSGPACGIYNWNGVIYNGFRTVGGELPAISFIYESGNTSMGRIEVIGIHSDDWAEEVNGTFTMTINDGNRPNSIFIAQLGLERSVENNTTDDSTNNTTDGKISGYPIGILVISAGVILFLIKRRGPSNKYYNMLFSL